MLQLLSMCVSDVCEILESKSVATINCLVLIKICFKDKAPACHSKAIQLYSVEHKKYKVYKYSVCMFVRVCVCVCVCERMFLWQMRTYICIMTQV